MLIALTIITIILSIFCLTVSIRYSVGSGREHKVNSYFYITCMFLAPVFTVFAVTGIATFIYQ